MLPKVNVPHWRHPAGDCDPWSEPEGEWHLGWKERFPIEWREAALAEGEPLERHRADLLCASPSGARTVVELQHSSIAEHERDRRDAFYQRYGRKMFWLVHIHDASSFNSTSFALSWRTDRLAEVAGQTFAIMRWHGRSKQFIEKWKRSAAHVFFCRGDQVFYLATRAGTPQLHSALRSGEFAVSILTPEAFVAACGA